MQKASWLIALATLFTLTGLVYADEVAPIISNPQVNYVSDTVAVITWETDELSNSIIRYGLTSNSWGEYAFAKTDAEMLFKHVITITSLQPETKYFFRVGSGDSSGNGPETSSEGNNPSIEKIVKTELYPDLKAPEIISPPTVTSKTDNTAVLEWQTDEPADSLVQYGTTSNVWGSYPSNESDSILKTHHSVILDGLSKDTLYFFRVGSVDVSSNGPSYSLEMSFITDAEPDTKAPVVILPPTITAFSDTRATIEWETDEPGNSIVQYRQLAQGESPDLDWNGQTNIIATDPYMVTRHRVIITGLSPSTKYQYRVGATDLNGNGPSTNPNEKNNPFIVDTFITDIIKDEAAPKILSNPVVSATDNQTVIIEWDTDEPAASMVRYASQENLQDVGSTIWEKLPLTSINTEMDTHHRVTITGLNPSTDYAFRVGSTDVLGNGPDLNQDSTNASVLGTFKTTEGPDNTAPKISEAQVFFITNNTALITWKTVEPSNSIIKYIDQETLDSLGIGTTWEEIPLTKNDAKATRYHSVTLTGVQPETTYVFRIGSTDFKGNGPELNADASNPSDLMTFTTAAGDDRTAPQIIGDVEVTTIADKYVVLEWVTDEPGNSQIQYSNPESDRQGEAGSNSWGSYPLSENDAEMVTTHKVTLTGLTPDSLYFFRVSSTDAAGNSHAADFMDNNPSMEYNFKTKVADPPSIIVVGNEEFSEAYPKIDYANNTIDITYDEPNLNNATGESYYIFSPTLIFITPGSSIQEVQNGKDYSTYRLNFQNTPPYIILNLTLADEITDADGYPVNPSSVLINDNDADDLPDDWEINFGLDPSNSDSSIGEGKEGDFDGGGINNYDEYLNGTDPSDPKDDTPDIDNDDDGFTENQGDCDDDDDTVYPGATDTCEDGIDQDCSGDDRSCPDSCFVNTLSDN